MHVTSFTLSRPDRAYILPMLTAAEKQSLALTLAFLVVGGGLKIWRKSQTRLGPFEDQAVQADASVAESPPPGLHGVPRHGAPEEAFHAQPPDAPEESPPSPPGSGLVRKPSAGHGDPLPERRAGSDSAATGEAPVLPHAARTDGRRIGEVIGGRRAVATRPSSTGSGRSGGRKEAPASRVALDRATAAELAEVPGIGPRTAEAIVGYRAAKGPFRDLRDLLNVKGIGEKKLERLRPYLVLSPEGSSD